MTFAWQSHAGDRTGVRIPFTPPIADPVPFTIEIILPFADDADVDFGDVVFTSRLPLFYWKTDVSSEQPLQRGMNDFILPRTATILEFGMYRNTQNQILNDEYIFTEATSNYPILKKVIYKLRVPVDNINLPRFGERDYEIDLTRFNTRKPLVISSIDQVNSIQNAEVSRKDIVGRFNQPTLYPLFFNLMDALNQVINVESSSRLATTEYPTEHLKRAVLNDSSNQVSTPYVLASAYLNGVLFNSTTSGSDTWQTCDSLVYPIKGSQFGQPCFVIPEGTRAFKFQFTYNRITMNQDLISAGKAQAWERVFIHLSKQWQEGTEVGKHNKDSRVEILEVLYPYM